MFFRKLYGEYLRHVRRTSPVVDKLPRVVQIEPINVCNLDCPVCSVHHISETKRRYLRAEEFRKIAEQLEPETHIYLVGWGEPFLNPEVFEVIREGKRLGHIMAIDSNLNIDPELVPKIVDSGLDILKASIDGATQENYEKYRIKGDFDKAFGNLSGLVEEKIRINSATPKLSWQFIVNRHSEKDMDRARELVASLPGPVKLRFISMGLRQEKVDWMNYSGEEMEDMKKEWLPSNPEFIKPQFKEFGQKAITADTRCSFLWGGYIDITANMDVNPCCHSYISERAFGNLRDSSIREIFNNEKFVGARKYSLGIDDPVGAETICSQCNNFLRIPDPNIFVRHWRFIKTIFGYAIYKFRRHTQVVQLGKDVPEKF